MYRLTRDTRGAVYVEFLITFIPVFLVFVCMVQLAMIFVAGLTVQRAATAAARAAAVVLDDNPRYYNGERRMAITADDAGTGATGLRGLLQTLGLPGGGGGAAGDLSRFAVIRTAAEIPLVAIAPPPGALFTRASEESVGRAIGTIPAGRAAFALVYHRMALAVTFPDGPGSKTRVTSWSKPSGTGVLPPEVRVRVSYLFHCAVPLANRIMCRDGVEIAYPTIARARAYARFARSLGSGGDPIEAYNALRDELRRIEQIETTLSPAVDDLRQNREAMALLALASFASDFFGGPILRFAVIGAEAQMPIHYAHYEYRR
jgi:hypothetical protein